MKRERKHYSAEEKAAILRRHLLDKVAVSDPCEELGLQPTVFYRLDYYRVESSPIYFSPIIEGAPFVGGHTR